MTKREARVIHVQRWAVLIGAFVAFLAWLVALWLGERG
jgi:hypothetical protein